MLLADKMIFRTYRKLFMKSLLKVNSATSSMNFCVPIYRSPEFESWFLYFAHTSLLTPLLGSFTLHATLHAVLSAASKNWDIWYWTFWNVNISMENPNSIKGCPKYRSNDVTFDLKVKVDSSNLLYKGHCNTNPNHFLKGSGTLKITILNLWIVWSPQNGSHKKWPLLKFLLLRLRQQHWTTAGQETSSSVPGGEPKPQKWIYMYTPWKINRVYLKMDRWKYDCFLLGWPKFPGVMLVSGSVNGWPTVFRFFETSESNWIGMQQCISEWNDPVTINKKAWIRTTCRNSNKVHLVWW